MKGDSKQCGRSEVLLGVTQTNSCYILARLCNLFQMIFVLEVSLTVPLSFCYLKYCKLIFFPLSNHELFAFIF